MLITVKGQVTIPQEIRHQLGFLPHTEVEFSIEGNKVVIRKSSHPQKKIIKKALQSIQGAAQTKLSTDQIMKLTRWN